MASELVALDQTELRQVFKALKNMGEEANEEAKRQSGALAEFARDEVIQKANSLASNKVAGRIAQGRRARGGRRGAGQRRNPPHPRAPRGGAGHRRLSA